MRRLGQRSASPAGWSKQFWHKDSIEELERELMWLANNNPASPAIHDILTELLEERGVALTSTHYEASVLSNCDPRMGSIERVQEILQEMKVAGVVIGGSVYAAVLKVSSFRLL
jgi:hypothetical protein